ncbi:hypothetical protein CHRY9390_01241 [Chryseobacterium aquaeductus]|uniref:Uncharacterized protein n=1 Tax=Chryseobacterium aquaeductus TaxID=2675056 RepID=A0A9N8MFL2_9FLAO|nr:hypothetical protein CHRY9390_01241 [Chryseobacterium potabilaquae]CAD7804560.1 hypothetical protein CHRY9390_01241 [Chryseobacterium aquaeductus]
MLRLHRKTVAKQAIKKIAVAKTTTANTMRKMTSLLAVTIVVRIV